MSERAVLTWLVLVVVSTIGCAILGSVAMLLVYGCWPLGRSQEQCLAHLQPAYLQLLPIAGGIAIGSLWTWRVSAEADSTRGR